MAINAGSIIASLDLDTGQFSTKLAVAQKDVDGFSGKLKGYGSAFEDLGKGLTLGVTAPIVGIGVAAGKSAIDFESAFAGVKKTVDGSAEDFKNLETGIRDMAKEIPASATAIAGVAEAAGQLGIEIPNIMDFTRVMIDLGESTNMTADEAATSLARFANITQMSQSDFDKLGSVIVELGNNLATTEGEIVSMSMRLAGAGSQIGLSEAQIMSFAGALSSVGIEAEAGGSAFSKVMIDMQLAVETNSERLNDFANVAGMTGAEFKKAFQEDAASAIIAFIEGLGNAEEQGKSAIAILDEMGITEIRLRDALLRASGASDVFTDSIEMGNKAWEENTALTKEAEQRYETTASQIEIAKNHLKDGAITIGEIVVPMFVSLAERVKDVSDWFSNLDEGTQETIVKMAGLAAAVGPVLLIGGKLDSGLGSIIGLFKTFSGGAALASAAVGTGTVAGGIGLGAGLTAGLATIAPWALAIVGAGLAVKGLADYLQEDTIPAVEIFDETISETTKETLGNFLTMSDEAVASLDYLGMSGTRVSEGLYEDMTSKTNQMADEVIAKLEEQKEEGLRVLDEYLGRQTEMTLEEKEEAIRIATEKYDGEILKATEGKARIEEILSEAKEKNRAITDEERIEIEAILEDLKENSIMLMTESAAEQEKILENLKNNAERLSAEQMAAVVANSIEQKEKTIAEAEEQYENVLAAAELLKKDGTAESVELADNMIAEAKRQKEDTIAEAEEMHEKVLAELKAQGGSLFNQIDTDNGKIKTKWNELKDWFMRNPIIREIFTKEKDTASRERNDRLNPVGRNALGTENWRGGLTWVGEQGPEIVDLPQGSKVYDNNKSMQMMAQEVKHSGTIRIEGVSDDNSYYKVVDIVMEELRREARL